MITQQQAISWFAIGFAILKPAIIVATAVAGIHIILDIFLRGGGGE